MAQGRMLKKRISKSRKFAALKSHNARLLYLMIYPHLDIEGRIEADPRLLKADVAPLLNFSERKITEYLEDMHRVGLIILYTKEDNGDLCLECTKFKDFQVLRENKEAPSNIPAPSTGQVRELDGSSPALSKGKDKVKISKDKHKDFVFLSSDEYQKLIDELGEAQTKIWIEQLNNYIGSKGKKYQSHYHTILNWQRRKNPPIIKPTEEEAAAGEKREFEAKRNKIRQECSRFLQEKSVEELKRLKNDRYWKPNIWLIDEFIDKANKEK